jgi:organic hydroperoxide reductase OsmC/OhrA
MTPVIHTKTLLNRAHCGLPYRGFQVELEMGERSPNFKGVHVIVRTKVPMIKENQFQGLANAPKNGCLISRLLKIDVSMDATVDSSEPIRIAHIAG